MPDLSRRVIANFFFDELEQLLRDNGWPEDVTIVRLNHRPGDIRGISMEVASDSFDSIPDSHIAATWYPTREQAETRLIGKWQP